MKLRYGKVYWFTGLSGSGKTTIAKLLRRETDGVLLDGDECRWTLCSDLGFSKEDRAENVARVGAVAKLVSDSGVDAIVSLISPYATDRDLVKENCGADRFVEIYVATPLEICEKRDVKGLYKRARAGEIEIFTGVSDPYVPPFFPDITLNAGSSPEGWLDEILHWRRSN